MLFDDPSLSYTRSPIEIELGINYWNISIARLNRTIPVYQDYVTRTFVKLVSHQDYIPCQIDAHNHPGLANRSNKFSKLISLILLSDITQRSFAYRTYDLNAPQTTALGRRVYLLCRTSAPGLPVTRGSTMQYGLGCGTFVRDANQ